MPRWLLQVIVWRRRWHVEVPMTTGTQQSPDDVIQAGPLDEEGGALRWSEVEDSIATRQVYQLISPRAHLFNNSVHALHLVRIGYRLKSDMFSQDSRCRNPYAPESVSPARGRRRPAVVENLSPSQEGSCVSSSLAPFRLGSLNDLSFRPELDLTASEVNDRTVCLDADTDPSRPGCRTAPPARLERS